MKSFFVKFTLFVMCSIGLAQGINAQRIAVVDFNAGVGISQADVDGISAIFYTYFSPQGYTLVERTRIDKIIDEQQFQRGKLTEQQMVKIGQILNISQIVVGDVNIVMNQYNIDVRVLNVQSGTIAAKDGATWSQGSSYRTMMQQLASRLADQIAIKSNTSVSSTTTQKTVPTGVVVLYSYLKVYPEDLGQFDSYPQRVVEQINKNADYGYDTWRLPTKEEMQLIQANKEKIAGLTSANYMTSNSKYEKGTVRLVTDGATKAAAYEAYKLCSTIDEYRNFVQQFPFGTYTEMAREKIKALQMINGYEYVDLGLPSGLKWATCNVGAKSPSEYGNYYAWGETTIKTSYTEGNSKTYNEKIGDIGGNASYDAARANWGGTWRMPTKAEFDELLNKCTWKWTSQGGSYGYKVTGPNGNSIFLPAAGTRHGTSLYGAGSFGYYWSSTPYESDTQGAFSLYFRSDYRGTLWGHRYYGLSVRPVSE